MSRSLWLTRVGVTLLTTVSVGVAGAPSALAASTGVVSVTERSKVQYRAATGKQNRVVVTRSGRTVTIDDRMAIRAGKGCKQVKGDRTRVRCTLRTVPTQVRVHTYDRADSVTNRTGIPLNAEGGSAADVLTGGSADDRLHGGTGADRLSGGAGNDWFSGGTGHDRISGGAGRERIFAGPGNDVVYAGDGDDYLDGDSGNDRLFGQAGKDIVLGEQGADHLDGGAGEDYLVGDDYSSGTWADVLLGGDGVDVVSYGLYERAVTVDLTGTPRNDGRSGERDTVGADVEDVYGGGGSDAIYGNAAANAIYGNMGDDLIRGGAGNDRLIGLEGRDRIYGDAGDDWLSAVDAPELPDSLDGGTNGPAGDECWHTAVDTVTNCER
ncbi:calcium-binding protein [Actinoplanes sp. NPDC024001]|uniref:calcium-binding protein n=1 Tax=Actinoplanes sp. NPDC024001 TaxID=3154598 RepID=UPI0033E24D59